MVIRLSSFLSSILLFSSSTIIFFYSLNFCKSNMIYLLDYSFCFSGPTVLNFHLILDPLGLILSSAVLFISANIMLFTSFYMAEEKFLSRFTQLVMLFVFSMNMLIYIPHFMFLLLGWDGLGLTSFLLVIYYYSPKSLGAGMITALTNRVGDVLILISIGWCLSQGHWNIIYTWNNLQPHLYLLIMLAAMTKSAQIPFSSWLPAAMAAPTPVSALVHSSTLVTAGVFLLIRFFPFLSKFYMFTKILLLVAVITMLMAGSAAMLESDLKKIIALSTLSQLGVMMTAIALSSPYLAIFHLITHALFKALLFVTAGSLIAKNNHIQDLRTVGNILNQMPVTSSAFLLSNMALCALPFLAGFYSKDLILELNSYNNNNLMISSMLVLATILTAIYSMRFLVIGWSSMKNFQPFHSIEDKENGSIYPAVLLSLGAVMGGSATNWIFLSPFNEPFLSINSKLMPMMLSFLGLILAFITMFSYISLTKTFKTFLFSQNLMWFLVPISTQMMLKTPLNLSKMMNNIIDQGWAEFFGGQGALYISSSFSFNISVPQKNMPLIHLSLISMSLMPIIIFL